MAGTLFTPLAQPMSPLSSSLLGFLALSSIALAQQTVSIRFQAQVGDQPFVCGQSYDGIGTTKSKITGRDFRFYVSNVRLIDAAGKETPVALSQDDKWQLDDLALLDFENGLASCANGTADVNGEVKGTVPAGQYRGLRFILGVPFNRNHTDPLTETSPLNLTALFWVWNAGHKFARLDFSSTGLPRGFMVHLGSTGCTPSGTSVTVPTSCKAPNRVEVDFPSFDPAHDTVVADLAALLQDTNVDESQNRAAQDMTGMEAKAPRGMQAGTMKTGSCMSGPTSADCVGIFKNFGLPFGDQGAVPQQFFRVGHGEEIRAAR